MTGIFNRNTSIILLFFGLLFIITDIIKNKHRCRPDRIIYKYIPRTFEEEQENPAQVTKIFERMWSRPSPWVDSLRNYFISQS